MVELVDVAEGVPDGLEDRFQKIGVAIYTKVSTKIFVKKAQILLPYCRLPRKCVKQTSSCAPTPLLFFWPRMCCNLG